MHGLKILLSLLLFTSGCTSAHQVKSAKDSSLISPGRSLSSPKTIAANNGFSNKVLGEKKSSEHLASDIASLRGGISPQSKSEMLGVATFLALDLFFRRTFEAAGISFPSQLGGCIIVFASLILVSALGGTQFSDAVFNALSPGAGWHAKWLPVFFVPGLAMLPLAPSLGSTAEVRSWKCRLFHILAPRRVVCYRKESSS